MRNMIVALSLSTLLFCPMASATEATDWGDLKGRFVFDGEVPKQKTIKINKDARLLGVSEIEDESLLINKKNKGIANIAIYLYAKKGTKPPQAHPSYAKTAKIEVELKYAKGRIQPRMLLVRTSQTMTYTTSDKIAHNPHFFPIKNASA